MTSLGIQPGQENKNPSIQIVPRHSNIGDDEKVDLTKFEEQRGSFLVLSAFCGGAHATRARLARESEQAKARG